VAFETFIQDRPAIAGKWYDYDPSVHTLSPKPQAWVVREPTSTDGSTPPRFASFRIESVYDAEGATLGIYDYYTVTDWDWNLPHNSKASWPAAVASSIPYFYNKGARFYDCESGDSWGPNGLGFYIGARVMWDLKEADHVKELTDDFITKAFGPAKAPMGKFYQLINFDDTKRSSADLVGRMYRDLAEARKLAANRPDVLSRIDDLVLYTRYVELYNAFAAATGDTKGKLRDQMLAHAYRFHKSEMIHVYGLWSVTIGQGAALAPTHPLKSDKPFTEEEIQQILTDGIAANQPEERGFEAVTFTKNLVPADKLKQPEVAVGSYPGEAQDSQEYYIWMAAPGEFHMKVTVQKVWALRPHSIKLQQPTAKGDEQVDESGIVQPDGKPYDVVLHAPQAGLYKVLVNDGGDFTRIVWQDGLPVTVPSAADSPSIQSHFRGVWTLYFYVPKGTKVVGGWAQRVANWAPRISGVMKDGAGNVVFDFSKVNDGWFAVPVPKGQDGALWKFEGNQGMRQLMTVPPFLARNGKELLLPKEVVEKDAK
jgi:hypothetical protein